MLLRNKFHECFGPRKFSAMNYYAEICNTKISLFLGLFTACHFTVYAKKRLRLKMPRAVLACGGFPCAIYTHQDPGHIQHLNF